MHVKLAKSKQKFTTDILHINNKNSILRSADGLFILFQMELGKELVRPSHYISLNIKPVLFQLYPEGSITLSRH
jgi:hypothetical protein